MLITASLGAWIRRLLPDGLLLALLSAVVWAAHAPALEAFFVADDFSLIVASERGGWFAFGADAQSIFFRPLTAAFQHLTGFVAGRDPLAHRAFGLGLHTLNAWLLVQAARILLPNLRGTTWAYGVLFAVMPCHVEPVCWMSARADLLAGAFGLGAVWAWVHFRNTGRRYHAVVAHALLATGLLCKESLATLPLVWFVLDVAMLRCPLRIALRGTLTSFAVLACYVLVRWLVLGKLVGGYGTTIHTDGGLGQVLSYWGALTWRSLLPPLPVRLEVAWTVAMTAGTLALAVAALLYRIQQLRQAALLCMLTMLAAGPVVCMSVSASSADSGRFFYWPSVWLTLAVAALLQTKLPRGAARAVVLALLTLTATASTWHGARTWRAGADLAEVWLRQLPDNIGDGTTYLLNLPDARAGVYVFRNGLMEAYWLWHGIPKSLLIPAAMQVLPAANGDVRVTRADGGFVVDNVGSDSHFLPPAFAEATLPGGSRYRVEEFSGAGYQLRVFPVGPGERVVYFAAGTLHSIPVLP